MKKLTPVGERCLIEEDKLVTEVDQWQERTGLVAVQYEKDYEKPTSGKVVAVGSGPLINEEVKVGDTVFFSKHAGHYVTVEGKQYRNLEIHEITSVLREEAASETPGS